MSTAGTAALVDVAAANREAESALRAVVHAVADGPGLPPTARARAAVAGAYADLWICRRLAEAARTPSGTAGAEVVAGYLAPRLLLDGADGLGAALGERLHSPEPPFAAYRQHVRRLAALAGAPGAAARTRAVAARLPLVADGDDRLARPLTAVPATALVQPLRARVGALEEERQRVSERVVDPGPAGVWALTDRYALLTAAVVCLDGWRVPGSPRRRRSSDRMCLTGALSRLAAGLCLPSEGNRDWQDEVYEVAVALLGEEGAGDRCDAVVRQPAYALAGR
ncbi:hypothetical protein [Streptomyces swartbergensis]|uniref:hypothetical protein n=1 Tax=Streptomyces swartbergensis TaxID=487165 RepID=UPI0037F40CC9